MTTLKNLETPVFQLTVGELLTIIRQEQKTSNPEKKEPEIFGVKILQNLTGYSLASIYAKTSKNELPHFKRDGKLFFRRNDILNWLTENPISTTKEHCSLMDEKFVNRKRGLK